MRVSDILKVKAQVIPDRVAHDDTKRVMTFAEWDREADEVAGGLVAAGLKPGERVLLPVHNRDACEMAIAVIAVMRAGAISCPINTRLSQKEIDDYCEALEPRFAITNTPDKLPTGGVEKVWDIHEMPRDLASLPDQSQFSNDDDAIIIGTSGTTGKIKGVVNSHHHYSFIALRSGDAAFVDRHANSTLHALPFTSSGGMQGECLGPISAGMICYTLPTFDPAAYLKLVQEKRPTTLYLVPTMLRLILDHPDVETTDMSSVRYILTGTAPLPHDSVVRVFKHWPHIAMRNSYGMSEGGIGVSTRTREQVLKPGCVGTMPPHMQLRDEAGNVITDKNVVGEIFGKQGKARRYWRDPEATAKGFVGDWTKTGDLGYIDDDGDLILSGRSKELIIRGGFNITPLEIETVLHDHPAVKDAAVVGIHHEILGEDVAAAVTLLSGASATPEDLYAWCRERLADNKCPRTILIMDELPINQSAKVLKPALKPLLEEAAAKRKSVSA